MRMFVMVHYLFEWVVTSSDLLPNLESTTCAQLAFEVLN